MTWAKIQQSRVSSLHAESAHLVIPRNVFGFLAVSAHTACLSIWQLPTLCCNGVLVQTSSRVTMVKGGKGGKPDLPKAL